MKYFQSNITDIFPSRFKDWFYDAWNKKYKIDISLHTHSYTHTDTHIHLQLHFHTLTYIYIYIYMCVSVCVFIRMCMYIYICQFYIFCLTHHKINLHTYLEIYQKYHNIYKCLHIYFLYKNDITTGLDKQYFKKYPN